LFLLRFVRRFWGNGRMNLLHYGLQRSGTNYVETLLKQNYRIRFLNSNRDRCSPLQKHCRLYEDKRIIGDPKYVNDIVVETFEQFEALFDVVPDYYLIVSKDPYSWYLSYRNWAAKCGWPEVTHHYIEEYNLFYGKFLKLARQSSKFVFIRYVDLIRDPRLTMAELKNNMKLEKKMFAWLRPKLPNKVSQSHTFSAEKRAFYLNEEYLKAYEEKEFKLLNDMLDRQVASSLGYELRGVGAFPAR